MPLEAVVGAQGKVNLFLHVLAREESGYHQIETLLQRVELGDTVRVALADPGVRTLRCSEPVCAEQDNLAYRAAVAYLEATGWETGFRIAIEKVIPAGGGLGGGSADAAATLHALSALDASLSPRGDYQARLSPEALVRLSAGLGADVPFLTTGAATALAWGRGERLLTLAPPQRRPVVVLVPPFAVGTGDAYRWYDRAAARHPDRAPAAVLLQPEEITDWHGLAVVARNDLYDAVRERHPVLAEGVAALHGSGAVLASMTGSGSAVFGIFRTRPDRAALQSALGSGWRVLVTRTTTARSAWSSTRASVYDGSADGPIAWPPR